MFNLEELLKAYYTTQGTAREAEQALVKAILETGHSRVVIGDEVVSVQGENSSLALEDDPGAYILVEDEPVHVYTGTPKEEVAI